MGNKTLAILIAIIIIIFVGLAIHKHNIDKMPHHYHQIIIPSQPVSGASSGSSASSGSADILHIPVSGASTSGTSTK